MENMCHTDYERLFDIQVAIHLKRIADEMDFDIYQSVTSFDGLLSLHYAGKLEVAVPDKVRNAILNTSCTSKFAKKFQMDVMQGYIDHLYKAFGLKAVWSQNLDILYLNV